MICKELLHTARILSLHVQPAACLWTLQQSCAIHLPLLHEAKIYSSDAPLCKLHFMIISLVSKEWEYPCKIHETVYARNKRNSLRQNNTYCHYSDFSVGALMVWFYWESLCRASQLLVRTCHDQAQVPALWTSPHSLGGTLQIQMLLGCSSSQYFRDTEVSSLTHAMLLERRERICPRPVVSAWQSAEQICSVSACSCRPFFFLAPPQTHPAVHEP